MPIPAPSLAPALTLAVGTLVLTTGAARAADDATPAEPAGAAAPAVSAEPPIPLVSLYNVYTRVFRIGIEFHV